MLVSPHKPPNLNRLHPAKTTNKEMLRDGLNFTCFAVLLPGLCLEILIIFVQMTDSLKNFQKFNVQLSWIRWVVTALEALSFDSKTHALR